MLVGIVCGGCGGAVRLDLSRSPAGWAAAASSFDSQAIIYSFGSRRRVMSAARPRPLLRPRLQPFAQRDGIDWHSVLKFRRLPTSHTTHTTITNIQPISSWCHHMKNPPISRVDGLQHTRLYDWTNSVPMPR